MNNCGQDFLFFGGKVLLGVIIKVLLGVIIKIWGQDYLQHSRGWGLFLFLYPSSWHRS